MLRAHKVENDVLQSFIVSDFLLYASTKTEIKGLQNLVELAKPLISVIYIFAMLIFRSCFTLLQFPVSRYPYKQPARS